MFLVDSHCHLHMLDLKPYNDDLQKAVEYAKAQGVGHILNVCVSMQDFPIVLRDAEQFDFVSASVGLHPNEKEQEPTEEELVRCTQHKKVVGIGETGLDYYRSTGDLNWQRNRFRTHIRAAKKANVPLIVHSRQAKADTIQVLKEEGAKDIGGVMHCFTEDWEMAEQALDLGFYISFSGIVTFKNAPSVQEVAKRMPLDRMLVETDAPYLAPNPKRGKSNEPAFVVHTVECIADLRGMKADAVAEVTTENFFTLFKKAKR